MGVRVHSTMEADFARFLQNKENKLYALLAEAIVRIMHEAEWEMKGITARAERIDTAAMFDALGSKVEFAARTITAEAGFIDGAQDYYIYQTVTGFQHYLSGNRIEPTRAIAEAGTKAYYETLAAIQLAIRLVS